MANHLIDQLFARGRAAAPALILASRVVSYADLDRESARYANALVALGVAPGDRVAAQLQKSAANLILYLATVRAGAVFLPLNPAYTAAEIAYFLGDAEPRLLVCDPAVRDGLSAVAGHARLETLDGAGEGSLADLAAVAANGFDPLRREPDDLAALCYTSGTTGRSKGAMLTHGNLASNAETLKGLWRFTADDVLIHALPIYHVHGLFIATNVLLMAGGAMILQPKFDAGAVLAAMPRATALMGVPTFYTRLLAQGGLTREATAGMRLFVCGSAPLLAQTHLEFERRTGQAILERYGMTETGMNASNPYDGERRPGAVGFALPGVNLRVASPENGAPLTKGEIGVVEVNGPNVFAGYWRNPDKTAAEFRPDGYFITGDLGVFDERGYLSIVGRGKDLIIRGGLNVYPSEIEAELDRLPGVRESAVVGLPDADLGEAVAAIVVAGEAPAPSEPDLLAALAQRLARYKLPRRIVFVDDLPRNAMGKVQKALLRERYAALFRAPPPAADASLECGPKTST